MCRNLYDVDILEWLWAERSTESGWPQGSFHSLVWAEEHLCLVDCERPKIVCVGGGGVVILLYFEYSWDSCVIQRT